MKKSGAGERRPSGSPGALRSFALDRFAGCPAPRRPTSVGHPQLTWPDKAWENSESGHPLKRTVLFNVQNICWDGAIRIPPKQDPLKW